MMKQQGSRRGRGTGPAGEPAGPSLRHPDPSPRSVRGARLSIVIPAYNESETIVEALRRVKAAGAEAGVVLEIIVVDDASTDGTRALLEAECSRPGSPARHDPGGGPGGRPSLPLVPPPAEIRLIAQPCNQGKGAAIRAALEQVTGDVVIIQDADLEYDPRDYPALAAPILAGQARVVYGSRFLRGRPRMAPANYLCNRLLAMTANLLFGARLTDEATCYKAFDAALLRELPLTCRRFEFCPEVTAKVLRRGERILEVPIHYDARPMDAGKKIRWWDGVIAFWTLLKYRWIR